MRNWSSNFSSSVFSGNGAIRACFLPCIFTDHITPAMASAKVMHMMVIQPRFIRCRYLPVYVCKYNVALLSNGCYDQHVNSDSIPFAFHSALYFLKRSEEHTSELQSRGHIVCRHLLE